MMTTDNLQTIDQVMETLSVSRTTIYRFIRERNFPPPIKLGPGCNRWPASEVEDWVRKQPRAIGR